MRLMRWSVLAVSMGLAACAAVQVPPNVQVATRSDGAGEIKSIDFSYTASFPADFKRLKLCVAENVDNGPVTLKGGSQVMATPWGILQHGDSETLIGNDGMRYADDDAKVLIASGETSIAGDALNVLSYSLRYQLRGSVDGARVGLVFRNLQRAQKDTGYLANDGYRPVGTWAGGRAMDVYKAVQGVSDEIRSCMRG